MTSTLDHLEKTLADSYRKEVDQEENVWRSLPFFAAAIAFQIVSMSQAVLRLPAKGTGVWLDAIVSIAIVSILIFLAIGFLIASIAPAPFSYIANETALLQYARGLDEDEADTLARGPTAFDAMSVFKGTLADQYAVATTHNRQINQRRAFRRSVAGVAILLSTGVTMFLIARLMLYYLPNGT